MSKKKSNRPRALEWKREKLSQAPKSYFHFLSETTIEP